MLNTAQSREASPATYPMDLGIVIVNWNVRQLLAACLDSVYLDLAQSNGQLKAAVCVVDNGSTDGSTDMLRVQFPHTLLLESENVGMGAGNNRGLRLLSERHQPFALLVLNPAGSLQHAGFRFPALGQALFDLFPPPGRLGRLADSPINGRYPAFAYQSGTPFQVDHTLGAAFAVRAEAIAACGLFDETFQMYCEEVDWHWRLAAAGWERWIVPAAEVIHYGGRSAAQVPAESFVRLWTSRRRLYYRYHSPALNALLKPLVRLAMRQRIRANHRRSQRGQMSADERAAMNQALTNVIEVWQRRRPPL